MILLVVDTQKGCFDERLFAFEIVRDNIKQLISVARENNVEVIYVQHDDGPGTDLDKFTDNYEIYELESPNDYTSILSILTGMLNEDWNTHFSEVEIDEFLNDYFITELN